MEWHGGDVTGLLPYSRIKGPPANVVAEERTDILAVSPAELPRMIQECHELTAVLVHVMLDRARVFKSSELLDEKVASLGRLAAGLAHELNNPASAVARSAKTLVSGLEALDDATARFSALNLTGATGRCRRRAARRPARAPRARRSSSRTGRMPSTTGSARTMWTAWTPSRSPGRGSCRPTSTRWRRRWAWSASASCSRTSRRSVPSGSSRWKSKPRPRASIRWWRR